VTGVSAARRLARFALGLTLDAAPAPVVARATLLALDTLGNALAASREDFGRAVLVTRGDLRFRVAEERLAPGARVVVSVRPHDTRRARPAATSCCA
jgi:hypothetical protein